MPYKAEDQKPPVCDYEGSDYQTSFWELGDRAYEDQVEAVALRRLLPPAGDLLLEVGAGAGRNTPRYQGFKHIVLLDYSRTQLRQAQERLGRAGRFIYVAADVYHLPFVPGLFNTITMIRVLHHMAEARRALTGLRKVLHPEGILVLEYANKHHLKAMLRHALGRQEWSPYTHEPVEFAPLNFDFHPAAVRAWLQESGFILERQLTVSHFRIGFLKRWVPLSILVGLDSLAQWTGDWWQLTPSVFTRSRGATTGLPAPAEAFFQCPACETSLAKLPTEGESAHAEGDFECPSCNRPWALRDGIYDFKAGE
jgi:ubiquinone/menaquinone biosynthesis C-methylase UbiE